uniref:Uncharacterized protein n=1 Tax=Eptatretus burgeri TaxID=7764 RepID=A0A8C4QIR6_EPTBU
MNVRVDREVNPSAPSIPSLSLWDTGPTLVGSDWTSWVFMVWDLAERTSPTRTLQVTCTLVVSGLGDPRRPVPTAALVAAVELGPSVWQARWRGLVRGRCGWGGGRRLLRKMLVVDVVGPK